MPEQRFCDLLDRAVAEEKAKNAAFAALSERVTSLESSICSCPDCVMHREKARHTAPAKGACMTHAPSEEAPAWQRAKIGDRVQDQIAVILSSAAPHWSDAEIAEYAAEISALFPPEPAAPNPSTVNGLGREIGLEPAPPTEPAATVQDVREQALDIMANFLIESAAEDLATKLVDAGLLAGAPQPLTIDWNTALDAFHAASRGPHGTASDGVMAVLKLVPVLKVEG